MNDFVIPEPDDFTRAPELTVFAWLDKHNLAHETVTHAPTHTVAESRDVKTSISGGHTKNLFMKDKKGRVVLVSAWAESDLPLNQLHKHIGVQRLSFTKADLLWAHLKVTPGSVSAFGLIHDDPGQVRFVVDKALMEFDVVNFHPLRNDMTTSISRADFQKFVESTGRELEVVDFTALTGSSD